MLTNTELKQLLHYEPATGVFTWLTTHNGVKVGSVAGSATTKGYVSITFKGKSYLAHRLAWLYVTGAWPLLEIDHKNRVRNANEFDNLREATHMQNSTNRKVGLSGTPGVNWYKPYGKWRALIRVGKKKAHIGYYTRLEDALAARHRAEILHYGVSAFQHDKEI